MTGRFPWRIHLASLALAILFASGVTAQNPSTTIAPTDHRAAIRVALIKETPLGSNPADVQRFITTKLLPQGSRTPVLETHGATCEAAALSAKKGVKSIRVELGNYIDNVAMIQLTAPLLNEKEVRVEWAFDEHDRLIEIFVDKKTVTY